MDFLSNVAKDNVSIVNGLKNPTRDLGLSKFCLISCKKTENGKTKTINFFSAFSKCAFFSKGTGSIFLKVAEISFFQYF